MTEIKTPGTPGPWKSTRIGIYQYIHTLVPGTFPHICLSKRSDPRLLPDFNLIAKAPEMLQVLRNIIGSAPLTGLPLALEKDIQDAAVLLAKINSP